MVENGYTLASQIFCLGKNMSTQNGFFLNLGSQNGNLLRQNGNLPC